MDIGNESIFCVNCAAISPLNDAVSDGDYLFVFKVLGELKVSSQNAVRVLNVGQIAIFSLDREYRFSDNGNTAYFSVSGSMAEALMQTYGIYSNVTVQLGECAEDFFAICRSADAREQAYILHGLLRKISVSLETQSRRKADTAQLIRDYIDANAGQKLTLDAVSEVFFLSKSQIFRIFKGKYGIPPMHYYMQKKVEMAREMLKSTDMRISDIAETLGFSDAKHLSSAFFALYGLLPKNFRKETKSQKSDNI